MADQVVSMALEAKVSGFKAGVDDAKRSLSGFTAELDKASKKRQALDSIGSAAGKMGLAAAAGLGLAAKAAMDWESSWAGVEKTVDGSRSQMSKLESDLRGMAKTLPATHTEIAAVAEAAGQLGVAVPDIASFTRVMIDMGETTNMTADEAATSIAQLMNVMQTAPGDVDNLASTVVALGNAGASTEKDIVSMAQRLSGAGQLIGASESDVLALSSSMADLGIQSELGGGAMSRILLKIEESAKSGGEELAGFGAVAGMSAQEFAQAWEADPIRALDAFNKGLGGIDASGGNVIKTLDDLGIEGTQNLSVMLRMAGAQDGLTTSLDRSGEAWDQNTALAVEAAKRYDTTASKTQVAMNQIRDAGIEMGDTLLPIIGKAAEGIGSMANAFGSLPQPIQTATTGLLGVTAVLGGGAWFATKAISGVNDMKTAMTDLGVSSAKAGKLMKGVGIGAALLGSAALIDGLQTQSEEALPGLEALTKQLIEMSGASVGSGLSEEFDSIGESINRLADANPAQKLQDSIYGAAPFLGSDSNFDEAKAEIEALDAALTGLVANGSADVAASALDNLAAAQGLSADELERLKGAMPGYAEALLAQENAADLAADSADGNAAAIDNEAQAAREAEKDHRALTQALSDARNERLRAMNATINYEASVDEATAAARANGRTLDINTEKGRANKTALLAQAGAWNEQSRAVRSNAGEQRGAVAAFVRTAVQMGMNEDKARKLARSILDIPPKRETTIVTDTGTSLAKVAALKAALAQIQSKTITVRTNTIGGVTSSAGGRSAPGIATGGHVRGPGTGTSDSINARLSDGEFVMKAQAVRRYGPGFMHQVNAMAFADGGPVSVARTGSKAYISTAMAAKGDERRERDRDVERKAHGKELRRHTAKLQQILEASKELQDTVAGNFKGDPFADNFTLRGAVGALNADTGNARDFRQAGRKARNLGLNGNVFRSLLESGNTAVLEDIDSRRDVRALEVAWRRRNKATADLTFGAATSGKWQGDSMKEISGELKRLRHELRQMGKRVEDGARKGTEGKHQRDRQGRKSAVRRGGAK